MVRVGDAGLGGGQPLGGLGIEFPRGHTVEQRPLFVPALLDALLHALGVALFDALSALPAASRFVTSTGAVLLAWNSRSRTR